MISSILENTVKVLNLTFTIQVQRRGGTRWKSLSKFTGWFVLFPLAFLATPVTVESNSTAGAF